MDWKLYFALSFAMFMEFAVWGAWMPVLAARLLGPLKMSGKQTGWIYATFPIACIFMPLVSGQLADKYVNTEIILAVAHLCGAILMFLAARKTTFKSLFVVMFLYSVCYAATLPLVNAILFANVPDVANQGKVFIWAPVAWAIIGWFLTGWRWIFKTGEKGQDCLYLAAILSVIMGIGCFVLLPAMKPSGTGEMPIIKAMALLKDGNFLIFVIVSMVFFALMQFYFLGTAPFMQDIGIPPKNVPASMGIAQAVQAIATWSALGVLVSGIGYKWTLVVGASCWFLLYVIYLSTTQRWLIVRVQSLHGVAYVLFVIAGQIFANSQATDENRNSTQAMLFAATTGVGLFLGTQFAGFIMDMFRKEGKFNWSRIFAVSADIALISVIVLLVFFKG